jgi:DNA-binding response OmpR family regulator
MDVLLVEDEELVRHILAEDLEEAGFHLIHVPSAEQGIAAAEKEGPPRVLVTDVNLGAGMNGIAFAAQVTERWPAVTVFVMTGDERNLRLLSLEQRQSALLKPFSPPLLVAAVRAVVHG